MQIVQLKWSRLYFTTATDEELGETTTTTTTVRSSERTDTFLSNREKVTDLQDVITRMKNEGVYVFTGISFARSRHA